ncbi:MAG: DUF411 domain-containing protein [Gemmatimonadaceae bacterium]|nr:DUF411 domain-containing protein [Gemmatimonadaceae bacterium]
MKAKTFLFLGVALLLTPMKAAAPAAAPKAAPVITVYKDPDCGCCKKWVEYLRKHGFRVNAKDTREMDDVKQNLGVPKSLTACHTAVVGGYVIEGHVPAGDIEKLLKRKPQIAGLAVAGMPAGSPGMEGPPPVHYQVIAFERSGRTHVFANH